MRKRERWRASHEAIIYGETCIPNLSTSPLSILMKNTLIYRRNPLDLVRYPIRNNRTAHPQGCLLACYRHKQVVRWPKPNPFESSSPVLSPRQLLWYHGQDFHRR